MTAGWRAALPESGRMLAKADASVNPTFVRPTFVPQNACAEAANSCRRAF